MLCVAGSGPDFARPDMPSEIFPERFLWISAG
jgi:hypothetical protein